MNWYLPQRMVANASPMTKSYKTEEETTAGKRGRPSLKYKGIFTIMEEREETGYRQKQAVRTVDKERLAP